MFMLLSVITYAQEISDLQGLWKGKNSTYYVAILHDGEKFTLTNFSIKKGDTIKEVVVEEGKNYIITNIFVERNKHSVNIKYTIIDNNTILCEFFGSSTNVSKYKRIKLN